MNYNYDNNITLITVGIVGETREDIIRALTELASNDNDFNGENGEEYLWNIASESGFNTNIDYVLNEISNIEDNEKAIEKFIEMWIFGDSYYFSNCYNIITNDENKIVGIAVAFYTD